MTIPIKRAYEAPDKKDGKRVLVDRLWPRGLTKEKAAIDAWIRDIAPSNELRQWFGHDPEKWDEFQKRFKAEMDANSEAVKRLQDEVSGGKATLIYSAKDEAHNNAVVIQAYLYK
ncbi:MAG: DUF488 domain-containing protein [Candidatus Saccharimonas sp.]